jgi:hypothetical protein
MVIASDAETQEILTTQKISSSRSTEKVSVKFSAPDSECGEFMIRVNLMNDSYSGLDQQVDVKIIVK